jgi:spermidine/putrescine transport system permease protein
MWMNFLLRTYSWLSILENNGLLNQFFRAIGVIDLYNSVFGTNIEYFCMIGSQGAVDLGMVYNYLPFMILPIYSVIVKLDRSLLEAASDLGANPMYTFRKVIFPLSLPGILSGITMVFVPAVSTFYISQKLGGTDTVLIGDVIERQFKQGNNPNLGAALSLVLMLLVFVCTGIMNKFADDGEGGVIV